MGMSLFTSNEKIQNVGKGEHGRFYSGTGNGEHENGDDIFIHNIVLPHMVCPTKLCNN